MKSESARRFAILEKIEAAENAALFEQFYIHPVGGFEQSITESWTSEDVYEVEQLIRRGFVEKLYTKGDEPWLDGAGPDAIRRETYLILTPAGHDFLEEARKNWWRKQTRALANNVLTVGVSVLTSLFAAWAVSLFGPGVP